MQLRGLLPPHFHAMLWQRDGQGYAQEWSDKNNGSNDSLRSFTFVQADIRLHASICIHCEWMRRNACTDSLYPLFEDNCPLDWFLAKNIGENLVAPLEAVASDKIVQ